jgi:hypothetical protein
MARALWSKKKLAPFFCSMIFTMCFIITKEKIHWARVSSPVEFELIQIDLIHPT